MVYPPSEDSYLLAEEVKKYIIDSKNNAIKILDMGSGSGIQALSAVKAGANKKYILCADIDEEAIKLLKKQKLNSILSDLFEKITGKFDLIIFNAPYLPEDKYDAGIDTTAGKEGNEIILKFLKQAKIHLSKKGAVLLLFSSLSKPNEILREAKKTGYKSQQLAKKNIGMMETLFVYMFKYNSIKNSPS